MQNGCAFIPFSLPPTGNVWLYPQFDANLAQPDSFRWDYVTSFQDTQLYPGELVCLNSTCDTIQTFNWQELGDRYGNMLYRLVIYRGGCVYTSYFNTYGIEVEYQFPCFEENEPYYCLRGDTGSQLEGIYNENTWENLNLYITGTLTIDRNITWRNCHVVMAPNAKIIVQHQNQSVTFTIDSTLIEGCTGLWKGIRTIDDNIKITYSSIQDADTALQFYKSNNPYLEIRNSELLNNKKHIGIANSNVWVVINM